jgi:hypothetical protein
VPPGARARSVRELGGGGEAVRRRLLTPVESRRGGGGASIGSIRPSERSTSLLRSMLAWRSISYALRPPLCSADGGGAGGGAFRGGAGGGAGSGGAGCGGAGGGVGWGGTRDGAGCVAKVSVHCFSFGIFPARRSSIHTRT